MGDCPDDCEVWMSPEDAIAEIMHVHGLTLEEACECLAHFIALNPLHAVMHDETMH
jgi:hypothetical protein